MLAKWMSCLCWVKGHYRKTFFAKRLFLEFLLSGGQTVDLGSNLRAGWQNSVKRAIECAFSRRCSSSGSRVMCRFVEKKCWKLQNMTFGDLWWPDLWPDLKTEWSLSVNIFLRSFDYRSPRAATWPTSRVRGGVKTPPPARHGKHRPPARRGLTNYAISRNAWLC